MSSKANPLHWAVVKESTVSSQGKARRMGSSCCKDLNSLKVFGERFLKAKWGKEAQDVWSACGRSSAWLVVRLLDVFGESTSSTSGFNWSEVSVLVVSIQVTTFTWWGSQYLQNSSTDMTQNIFCSPWGGTKGLWLCLMGKLLLLRFA